MPNIRRVIAYSGLDYYAVLQLPADVYMLMLKNSIVDDMRQTKEGREYLEKCARLTQTEPDRAAIQKYNNTHRG